MPAIPQYVPRAPSSGPRDILRLIFYIHDEVCYQASYWFLLKRFLSKQGNQGDLRKIQLKLQFLDSGPQGHFFEKKKQNPYRYGLGECTKFQVCIVFSLVRRSPTHTNPQIIYEQIKHNTLRLPHVDFDKQHVKIRWFRF